ncbi:PAS domain S-box protein [Candidatus Omnitrophota bacterium]
MEDKANKRMFANRLLRKLSIKNKMILIIMLVTSMALLLSCGIFGSYMWLSFRQHMVNDLAVQANMLANNSIGSLSFNDPDDAKGVLRSLRAKKSIESACIYRMDGRIFAFYQQNEIVFKSLPQHPQTNGHRFDRGGLVLFRTIFLDDKPIGIIYLQSNMGELNALLKRIVFALILTSLVSLVIAFLLSRKLHQVISGPVLSLTDIAGKVSAKKDYSIRAVKQSEDEVGHLIDVFNEMLNKIEQSTSALLESEGKYKEFVEGTDDLVTQVDGKGNFLFVNNKAEEVFGLKPEACIGLSAFSFIHPDDQEATKIKFSQYSREHILIVSFENRQVNRNGRVFHMLWTSSIHYDADGNVEMVNGIARDITERKHAEEELNKYRHHLEQLVEERTKELKSSQTLLLQSEKLASIGRLGAGVAHELNSPLMGVLSLVSVYKEAREEGSEEYKNLQTVENTCKHMAKIIKDLNVFSRQSIGELEDLDFNDIIEATLSFGSFQVKKKKVVVEKHFDKKLALVRGDRGQLQQVVLNLVINAMDAVKKGGSFRINTRNIEVEGSRYVEAEFIDDGYGIGEEFQEQIFDPFFTTKRPGRGVGLGLSIVYTIIKNHNGEIFVESESGKGTIFKVRLPAV